MIDEKDKLAWALEIARRGFLILPLQRHRKKPSDLWKNQRTCDADQIRAWFASDPEMNYGVCPGVGGAIIDIDTKNGKPGAESFDKIERDHLDEAISDNTFTVRSPSGGWHFYLTTPEGVTNGSGFGRGVDVRGESGYVVGPGCYYHGKDMEGDVPGYYSVERDDAFMEAPQWARAYMRDQRVKPEEQLELCEPDLPANISRGRQFLEKTPVAIEGFGGDECTFVTATVLVRDLNLTEETALDLMANYAFSTSHDPQGAEPMSWNDRCDPPWALHGFDSLETKIRNASRHGSHVRGEKSGAYLIQGLDIETIEQATAAALAMSEEIDERRARIEGHFYSGSAIFTSIKPMKWIIPYWLPGAGITGICGESGIGKSTILLDLALTLAHDLDWHQTPTRRHMKVVYTCGEDQEGAGLQMKAWCIEHGRKHPDPDRFIWVPGVPPLHSEEEVRLWVEVIRDRAGTKDVAVFIDTWQRACAGLSQNEEKEMQHAIKYAESLGLAADGPVIVAFHPPKSNKGTITGWEGQRNSSNALWFLEKDLRGTVLKVDKVRGEGTGNKIIFKMERRETGEKDAYFGFPLRHVVPVRVGGHRITADGEIHAEENRDGLNKAVAEVLAEMERMRADDTGARDQYTVGHAAERIVGNPDRPGLGQPPLVESGKPWAKEQIAKLEGAGLRFPAAHGDMVKLIEESLAPNGHILETGERVYIYPSGNKRRIAVQRGDLVV